MFYIYYWLSVLQLYVWFVERNVEVVIQYASDVASTTTKPLGSKYQKNHQVKKKVTDYRPTKIN